MSIATDLQFEAEVTAQNSADGWCYKTYAYNLEHPSTLQSSGCTLAILHVCTARVNLSPPQLSALLACSCCHKLVLDVLKWEDNHSACSDMFITGSCYMSARVTESGLKSDAGSSDPQQQLTITQNLHGTTVHHHFGLITLKLAVNLFEGATGCHEWEAGFMLAEFVFSNAGLFRGETLSMATHKNAAFNSCCLRLTKHFVGQCCLCSCAHCG